MLKNRIISLILCVCFIIPLIACNENNNSSEESSFIASQTSETSILEETSEEETTEPETTETKKSHRDNGLPTMTFEDSDFRILACEDLGERGAARDVVYLEDVETNSINEGVRDRNNYIRDTYNVNIKVVWNTFNDMDETVRQANRGELILFEACETNLYNQASFIDENASQDLTKVKYLDLTQDYWDQNCRTSMSICNSLYFIAGDIMISDKCATWIIEFNRDIITDNNMTDPYTLVDQKKWTYDALYEMALSASDIKDEKSYLSNTYGIMSEHANTYFLWLGNGAQLIVKDKATDVPQFGELTESAFDAMFKVATLQYDTQATLQESSLPSDITDKDIFYGGHSLFNIGSVGAVESLREYDMDFGVLPMPTLNEGNDRYYTALSPTWSFVYMIPSTLAKSNDMVGSLTKLEYVGFVSEALCAESGDTLIDGYYEKTMVYKGLRQDKDERMLELVFDSRLYDLSYVFTWAEALTNDISSAKSEKRVKSLKSKYDSYARNINNAIDKFLTKQGLK